ncbi:MAG: N-acetyltransferase [Planctomycetes bacterium]|nr:N-acetyltransferase [Planctomycetota bacterium]
MNIDHDTVNHRFVATTEAGQVMGEIHYQPEAGFLSATSTYTDPAFRGHGVAGALLDALAGYAAGRGWRIVPVCSYVAAAFQRDPDRYRSVLPDASSASGTSSASASS